jgi:hypothetical protein
VLQRSVLFLVSKPCFACDQLTRRTFLIMRSVGLITIDSSNEDSSSYENIAAYALIGMGLLYFIMVCKLYYDVC